MRLFSEKLRRSEAVGTKFSRIFSRFWGVGGKFMLCQFDSPPMGQLSLSTETLAKESIWATADENRFTSFTQLLCLSHGKEKALY